jgi:hypothetical protein
MVKINTEITDFGSLESDIKQGMTLLVTLY